MTTSTPDRQAVAVSTPPRVSPLNTLRIGLARGVFEIKQFFRERDNVVFTFALPIVLLALFGVIFGTEPIGQGLTYTQVLVPSLMVMGVAQTTMVNVGIWIATDRKNGALRRLVLTPMPRAAYFIGKVTMMLVVGLINAVILVGVGVVFYDVQLPVTGQKWLIGIGMLVLAFTVLGVLGIALASLPRSERSASAVLQLPALVLFFISGVFMPFQQLPEVLQTVAAIFPLKWIVQGLQSAFLPDDLAFAWPTESWEHDRILLVLGAWLIVGIVVSVTTFRWKDRTHG